MKLDYVGLAMKNVGCSTTEINILAFLDLVTQANGTAFLALIGLEIRFQETLRLHALFGSFMAKCFGTRPTAFVGGLLAVSGFFISSFATSLEFLYITSRFMPGLGSSLCLSPTMAIMGQYFPKRFPVANGIGYVGSVITLTLLPIIVQASIDAYGWRGAYLILSGYSSHVFIAAALLRPLPGHNSKAQNSNSLINIIRTWQRPSCSYLCRLVFCRFLHFKLFMLSQVLVGAAHFSVMILLQHRAVYNGVGTLQHTALVISLVGISSLVTRLGSGLIVQRRLLSATAGYILALFITGIACTIPHFSYSYAALCAFGVIFGLASGSHISLAPVCTRQYVGQNRFLVASGCFILSAGIGSLIGPPMAGECWHTIGIQVDETEWINKSDMCFILDSPLAS
ncbi:monocarboxylate transporter 12-like [Saccoglossus kowalevskii]